MTTKSKYQTKNVKFGGKSVVLFSLDGLTWSSRKDELSEIQARHEQQKIAFAQVRADGGEAAKAAKVAKAAKDANTSASGAESATPPVIAEKVKAIEPPAPRQKTGAKPKIVAGAKPASTHKQQKPTASPKKRPSSTPKAKPARGKAKRAAA
jgi:hypothetical protein